MKLLLLSNSTNPGEQYLEWATGYIKEYYQRCHVKKIVFIPYAGVTIDLNEYEAKVKAYFDTLGIEAYSIHRFVKQKTVIENAESIVVGGGNTFMLLKILQENKILEEIRYKVLDGTPYLGWSAGANITSPTICTTNDMPVIQPRNFNSLDLVRFQINPHYLDANPVGHGGETRQQRIEEYLEVHNKKTVVGLREASLLEIFDDKIELKGRKPMRVFKYQQEPKEFNQGEDVGFLLQQ